MVHCVVEGCYNYTLGRPKTTNKKVTVERPKVSYHEFPKKNKKQRKAWVNAVGRRDLPEDPHLCSLHFEEDCFEESYRLKLSLNLPARAALKVGAVPTIFPHKPPKTKPRESSEKRLKKKQRTEFVQSLLEKSQPKVVDEPTNQSSATEEVMKNSTSTTIEDEEMNRPMDIESEVHLVVEENFTKPNMADFCCQFPEAPEPICQLSDERSMNSVDQQGDIPSTSKQSHCESNDDVVTSSQELCESSFNIHDLDSSYLPTPSQSEDSELISEIDEFPGKMKNDRVFLVFESELKKLLKFCLDCGSPNIPEFTEEVLNEGSKVSFSMTCMSGCKTRWGSQPKILGAKGSGNVALSAAIFMSGIPFKKFQTFANILNLQSIQQTRFYQLREKFVFPIIEKHWMAEKEKNMEMLMSTNEVILSGDGRCDTPGHNAKYCTYTLHDTVSNKIIDFNVTAVTEVKNSNAMEKKGFVDVLGGLLNSGVNVDIISTDRHPQIQKELRVNYPAIIHQYDPWHIAKSISKKLTAVAKRSECAKLAPWIQSIVNHFWHCVANCSQNADIMKEKWLSILFHITGKHEWVGNQFVHNCQHEELTDEDNRAKLWLKPGSPSHKALADVVDNKRILKDMEKLTLFISTSGLEVYHSMYLKYLPKRIHYSHSVMIMGSMMAALDHNNNVNRPQAVIKKGEMEGQPKYKIGWSKVHKRFGAQPVLIERSDEFIKDIMHDVVESARTGTTPSLTVKPVSVMAPKARPAKTEIIARRLKFSRFK